MTSIRPLAGWTRPATQRPRAAVVAALLAALLAVTLLAGSGAAAAPRLLPAGDGEVRAVLVGVDTYDSLPSLKGAVADANDLGATLRRMGVQDVTLLVERAATRQAILRAMDQMAARALPGDLVMLAIAGHGMQLRELRKGSEADGLDEVFVLSGFRDRGKGTGERILDKEINRWLRRLEKRRIEVLFIADACFGGGLVRSIDPRADTLTYRTAGFADLREDELLGELEPVAIDDDAHVREGDFEFVTFVGAADEGTKVPEVPIEGQRGLRGALSYAVARAIEGRTDRDGAGRVSRRGLFEYARQVVYQHSQTRQAILTEPTRSASLLDRPIFRAVAVEAAVPARAIDTVLIRVAGDAAALGRLTPQRVPFRAAAPGETPHLVWDPVRREVLGAAGDIIARDVEPSTVPAIVDRTAAVAAIATLAEAGPQTITVRPGDGQHRAGAHIAFRVADVESKFLILFNVAHDGTVQFLYPFQGDPPQLPRATFELPLQVRGPYGADNVVAIVSDTRLAAVENAIRALDGRRAPMAVVDILRPVDLNRHTVRIGSAGLFTVP